MKENSRQENAVMLKAGAVESVSFLVFFSVGKQATALPIDRSKLLTHEKKAL
jgi:hypothetical protein